jgi:hypothetical protein
VKDKQSRGRISKDGFISEQNKILNLYIVTMKSWTILALEWKQALEN